MKRIMFRFLPIAFFLLSTAPAFSQEQDHSFTSNDWLVQTGIGFISNGFDGTMSVPPIDMSIERAISDNLAVGAYAGYAQYHDVIGQFNGDYGLDYGYMLIGISLSDHFNPDSPNLDLYGRVYLGYAIVSASSFGLGSENFGTQSDFATYGGFFGATYYLSHGFGLNGEVGYGNTAVIRVGLSFRL
ncbi:MAG TPA: hypothetical protein VLX91_10935 [Candidatus Acidoferrales bacterium]|nr:hypothetical protein [Candidatus Acidoferrales bacterium]